MYRKTGTLTLMMRALRVEVEAVEEMDLSMAVTTFNLQPHS